MRALGIIASAALLGLVVWAEPALAAKAAPAPWKIYWDWGWRIVNFLVLAVLIVKMARQPLKDFVSGQRAKVSSELEEMEKVKAQAQAELKAMQEKTAGLAQELESFEQALSAAAELERQRMLDDARQESELVLERARLGAEISLRRAKRRLAAEILELASTLAEEKLRAAVTSQDQSRLLGQFTDQALTAKPQP
ncbi:MAG: ATP synthase F0 subunit B [Thermodesulfobacteriota bacterium]